MAGSSKTSYPKITNVCVFRIITFDDLWRLQYLYEKVQTEQWPHCLQYFRPSFAATMIMWWFSKKFFFRRLESSLFNEPVVSHHLFKNTQCSAHLCRYIIFYTYIALRIYAIPSWTQAIIIAKSHLEIIWLWFAAPKSVKG